jgi:hypothetical protein
MNFMKIQVQIYLIVELFITIVESSLVLRQPEQLRFTYSDVDKRRLLKLLGLESHGGDSSIILCDT